MKHVVENLSKRIKNDLSLHPSLVSLVIVLMLKLLESSAPLTVTC